MHGLLAIDLEAALVALARGKTLVHYADLKRIGNREHAI